MPYIGRDTDKLSNVEVLDNITFDGSSSYTLQKGGTNYIPSSANNILVSIDGVVQSGNFTVSGSTIDFGTAIAGTSTCNFIIHYGIGLITTPADGTVTTAKLADSSVSLAKLTATGTKDATTFLRGDNTFATAGGDNTPAFRAYLGSNQNVSNNADSKINCNVEYFDTDNAYDSTTNYRFTVPTGKNGKYYFSYAMWCYDANAGTSNFADLFLKINGTTQGTTNTRQYGAFTNHNLMWHSSSIWNLNAGDYVELWCYQQFSTGINTVKAVNTYFEGFKLVE